MNSTLLKWAGSKARIMDTLVKHLPAGDRLVEPFAGSCAVMMNTDYPAYLVADVNPELINLYRQVQEFPQQLKIAALRLFLHFNTEEGYYSARSEFNECLAMPLLERAAYFLFLNRHDYRGLCRYNRRGNFNIPYGNYAKPYFPEAEIDAFALKAQRATFLCADFRETLAGVRSGDVVYCDPPYIGTFTGYHTAGFSEDDQYSLASTLLGLAGTAAVVASNSDTLLARSLYRDFEVTALSAPRSVGVKGGEGKAAKEIIATHISPAWLAVDPARCEGRDLTASVDFDPLAGRVLQ